VGLLVDDHEQMEEEPEKGGVTAIWLNPWCDNVHHRPLEERLRSGAEAKVEGGRLRLCLPPGSSAVLTPWFERSS
jgi:hypothetical protein